ncbi:MAG: FAD-dependent oxidoreductase, partial [Oscillospiraceae bacterium]
MSVIEMQSSLLPNELPNAAAQLSSALKKRGIGIHTGFSVKRIETRENGYAVVAGQGETEREFLADVVLMAIGRKPALRGVDAKALNLAMTPRGAIAVDDHLCTNLPGVYAIGDVIGGYQLAHAAYAEGEAAVAHLLGRDEALDETVMPRCIYTMPCFAAVGKTPAQIADLGRETRIGSFSYEGNGMALAEGASGTVYVIMDAQTTETLGVQIVGENASELISFAALAVADHTTLPLWEKMIVAHPSLSEMLREAALEEKRLLFQADAAAMAAFLGQFGVTAAEMRALKVSLFCYPSAPVA